MTIGKVAKAASVRLGTLRYYERRGLLSRPPRTASNYRLYPAETIRRVRFIRRAQQLGFTLEEIRDLLSLRARPGASCADALRQTQAKVRDIDGKVRTLRAMRKALTRLVSACSGKGPITECPILEALDPEETTQPPPRARSSP